MVKSRTKTKRSALNTSIDLSDQSSLIRGASGSRTNNPNSDECDIQTLSITNTKNTPRVSDQFSSTRTWIKLSEKIDKQFDLMRELNESTRKQLIECEERIVNVFESKIQIMGKEISLLNDKICALEAVAEEINSCKRELSTAIEKICRLESESEQTHLLANDVEILKQKLRVYENNAVACDLRINGVPYTENENLNIIFQHICQVIHTSVPAIKSIFRSKNLNNKRDNISPDAVIIVRMWSPYDKNFFLKTLSSFKKANKDFRFCLRHIGVDSNCLFFINENLTQTNYQILQAAVRLKRQKIIHSAFTLRGSVYVKKRPDDKPYRIDECLQLCSLDMFFPETHPIADFRETNPEHV